MDVARWSSALAWCQKRIYKFYYIRIFFHITVVWLGLLDLLLATEADTAGLLFYLLFKLLHFDAEPAKSLTLHLFGNSSQVLSPAFHHSWEGTWPSHINRPIRWISLRNFTLSVSSPTVKAWWWLFVVLRIWPQNVQIIVTSAFLSPHILVPTSKLCIKVVFNSIEPSILAKLLCRVLLN